VDPDRPIASGGNLNPGVGDDGKIIRRDALALGGEWKFARYQACGIRVCAFSKVDRRNCGIMNFTREARGTGFEGCIDGTGEIID